MRQWRTKTNLPAMARRADAYAVDLLEAGNVNQNGPQNHGWNRRHVRFANPPVAAPIGFLEAVIPVVVFARSNMPQAINLRGHVVANEQRRAMPAQAGRVNAWKCEIEVLLPLDPFGGSKH